MLKTLKKISATITLTVMAFIGLCFVTILPANADEPKTVGICHYDNGQGGKYTFQVVSKSSILKNSGETGGHGEHERDIIPPFSLNDGGDDGGQYPGRNWTAENQSLYGNGSGCAPSNSVLTPVLPVAPIQVCTDPTPTFTVPEQPAGITATSVADGKGSYTVTYTLPANTLYNTYTFPEGFKNPVTVTTIDDRPNDVYWSTEKMACHMPDTGAGEVNTMHLVYAGGLLGAGIFLTSFRNRRKA